MDWVYTEGCMPMTTCELLWSTRSHGHVRVGRGTNHLVIDVEGETVKTLSIDGVVNEFRVNDMIETQPWGKLVPVTPIPRMRR